MLSIRRSPGRLRKVVTIVAVTVVVAAFVGADPISAGSEPVTATATIAASVNRSATAMVVAPDPIDDAGGGPTTSAGFAPIAAMPAKARLAAPALPPPAQPAPTQRTNTEATTKSAGDSSYGCGPALAYLAAHAAPGFVLECPGYAYGRQAMTCVNHAPECGGEKLIAIAVPCAAAYMNEAHNSWVLIGQATGIDPYGYCH